MHPVLEDPDLSVPITLLAYDGSVTETRGVVAHLDETASGRGGGVHAGRPASLGVARGAAEVRR